ncbi:MAG TPA: DUF2203 domain-containing protein [Solirubrobacteraceae bacterium]|jgi:hypothetical protein
MQHERHYTRAEANAARPWVAARVKLLREAHNRLRTPPCRAALARVDGQHGGGWPGHATARAAAQHIVATQELSGVDVVVRDPIRGLVDFPALRDGAEVYLCWLVDEDEVAYWHAPEAGFAGRRPLEG